MKIFSFAAIIGLLLMIYQTEGNSTFVKGFSFLGEGFQQTDTFPGRVKYVDLTTKDTIDISFDSIKLVARNRVTGLPVTFYVNTSTGDTVYGRGRFIVNNLLLKLADGTWALDPKKVKVDGDELKIKSSNGKLKLDGDEIKVKNSNEKWKKDSLKTKMKEDD